VKGIKISTIVDVKELFPANFGKGGLIKISTIVDVKGAQYLQ